MNHIACTFWKNRRAKPRGCCRPGAHIEGPATRGRCNRPPASPFYLHAGAAISASPRQHIWGMCIDWLLWLESIWYPNNLWFPRTFFCLLHGARIKVAKKGKLFRHCWTLSIQFEKALNQTWIFYDLKMLWNSFKNYFMLLTIKTSLSNLSLVYLSIF